MSTVLESEELDTSAAAVRQDAIRRVIGSQTFAKAPRLCSFLKYIAEQSIEGDMDSLTEQQIGIHVFNRAPGYNSNDDNIVRGTARALRQRLVTYYLTEGLQDPVRVEIPKGAYLAHFIEAAHAPERVDALPPPPPLYVMPAPDPVPQAQPPRVWPLALAWSVAAVLAVACAALVYTTRVAKAPSSPLWGTLFTHDKPTLIVSGDAGLNMYEWMEKRTVDLITYSQQSFRSSLSGDERMSDVLGRRFYTPVSDLQLVSMLGRLPEASNDRVHVRFARDLAANDLKDTNLILVGTQSYDPWTELFTAQQTIKMNWDVQNDVFTVQNLAPQPGEQASYTWSVKNGVSGGYTLLSLTDNTKGSGRVLLIQGTTMGGVFAASDFLSDKKLLDPIVARAKRGDGSLRNFDVLLQSDFIREGVSNLRVLAVHVH